VSNSIDLNKQLQGAMEYYVRVFFNANKEEYMKQLRKVNLFLDPDMMELQVKDYLEDRIQEASYKFHTIAYTVLSSVVNMDEAGIRKFELLFIDLLERTLLKDIDKSAMQPIVILAENLDGRENKENG
jgi:hypothetical protein